MSSNFHGSQQQPLFVVYDRQFGNYVRLYENRPDQQRRFLLYDMRSASTFSGEWSSVGESVYNIFYNRPIHSNERIILDTQQNHQNRMLLDAPEPPQQQQRPQQQRQQQRPQQRPQQRQQSPSLPKFVADLILRNAVAEGARCPITMDPVEETEAFTVTTCYHVFNVEALTQWLREHSTCPECNSRL
jgi:hypothetical protein